MDPQKSKFELLVIYPVGGTFYGNRKQAGEEVNHVLSLKTKKEKRNFVIICTLIKTNSYSFLLHARKLCLSLSGDQ